MTKEPCMLKKNAGTEQDFPVRNSANQNYREYFRVLIIRRLFQGSERHGSVIHRPMAIKSQ